MKFAECLGREGVVPGVFGAVCKKSAVGADGACDEKRALCVRREIVVAGFLRKRHGQADEARGLRFVKAFFRKARGRSLIACGDGDVGAGFKVLAVHRADLVRVVSEKPRAPEGVVQVAAQRFKRGGHRAVDDDGAARSFDEVAERMVHGKRLTKGKVRKAYPSGGTDDVFLADF